MVPLLRKRLVLWVKDIYGSSDGKENNAFLVPTFSFWKFRPIENPRRRPETQSDNEKFKAKAAGCSVSDKTIFIHLKQIGKIEILKGRYLKN